MRRFVMALAVTGLLALSTKAGEIPSTDFVPPPPPPSATQTGGDMGGGGFTEAMTDELVLAIFGIFAG
jgi:hypothetical protein